MRIVRTAVLCVVLLSCGACVLAQGPAPFQFAFALVSGWLPFIARSLMSATVNWAGVATAVACTTGVLLLGHHLAAWLWRETRPTPDTSADTTPDPAPANPDAPPATAPLAGHAPWRPCWTLALAGVVVLAFVCGTAAVGITHQTVWLARSDRPMFVYAKRERYNRSICASRLRNIGHAVETYAKANGGRYPDTLGQILLSEDLTIDFLVCPATNHDDTDHTPGPTTRAQADALDHGHGSYVYHGRGLTTATAPADLPIVCEPLANHAGAGTHILFADGRVEWFKAADAVTLLQRARP